MQSLSEDEKRQVLGAVLADQLSALHDAVNDLPEIKKQLDRLEEQLGVVRDDVKVVKAAITSLSDQVNIQERQIAELKAF